MQDSDGNYFHLRLRDICYQFHKYIVSETTVCDKLTMSRLIGEFILISLDIWFVLELNA